MSAKGSIPPTLPVEFTERIIYLMGDIWKPQMKIGAAVSFDGALDEARLGQALVLLTDAEPVLGCRFVADTKPPIWQRLEGLGTATMLRVSGSENPAADASAFVAEPLDPCAGPQLQASLLKGLDGDTLAIKMTHVAVDGGAVKEGLYLLADIYRRLAHEPGWVPVPNLDGVRSPFAEAGLLEKFRAVRAAGINMPPSDWRIDARDTRGPVIYAADEVAPDVLRAAARLGKSAGATVNDIILTGYLRALCTTLQAAPGSDTPIQISCELRKHLPEGTRTALSNISNVWCVTVPPIADEDFAGTLARVVERTVAWKESGSARGEALAIPITNKVMRRTSLAPMRKMLEKGMMQSTDEKVYPTLTNIGIIDDALLDFGDPAPSDAWLLGPSSPSAPVLTASTYRDRLHLAIGFEPDAMDERMITAIATQTAQEIVAWVSGREIQVA